MFSRFTPVFAVLLFTTHLNAQPEIVREFAAGTHTFQGLTLPYRIFTPEDSAGAHGFPLVLALHGSGERGTENRNHISSSRLATAWADPANQADHPSIVVAPQVPQDFTWRVFEVRMWLVDIVDSLASAMPVDSNRLYITGLSMGGFGTWELLRQFPDKFAAAVPIAAGGNPADVPGYAHVPIWNFHGALDDVVSVQWSRSMMLAMEADGRGVLYTHCDFGACDLLSDASLSNQIDAGEVSLYSEYETGSHLIWDQSYDHPMLTPWVFRQFRQIPGAIAINGFDNHETLAGMQEITWTAANPQDTVDVWFTPDAGRSWTAVAAGVPNSGSFMVDTETLSDCAAGRFRLLLRNDRGFVYARSESGSFSIDNAENGKPFVQIDRVQFRTQREWTVPDLTFSYLAGDAEPDTVTLTLLFSPDNGGKFIGVDSWKVAGLAERQRTVDLTALPNTPAGRLKLMISDGASSFEDTTPAFAKNNIRGTGPAVTQTAGGSSAQITVLIADESALTGDRYQITVDDSSGTDKTYAVRNLSTGVRVLENETALDGVTESGLFDGLRLLIRDIDPPGINFAESGWQTGNSNLIPNFYLPSISGLPEAVPLPFDYQITFAGSIIDTSSNAFGAQPLAVPFTVTNLSENRPAEFIYIDSDADQQFGVTDEVFLVEFDESGMPFLTWAMSVSGPGAVVFPAAGDAILLKTEKPLTGRDVFEFDVATSLGTATPHETPATFELFQNYPNPFNPSTRFAFSLKSSSEVNLRIFNSAGTAVRTLIAAPYAAGLHLVDWDGRDAQGNRVASGMYIYRLTAGEQSVAKKLLLIR